MGWGSLMVKDTSTRHPQGGRAAPSALMFVIG
jgi:hypothetical protein